MLLQLEPRAQRLGRGAYWDWCRLLEQQQARKGQWLWLGRYRFCVAGW